MEIAFKPQPSAPTPVALIKRWRGYSDPTRLRNTSTEASPTNAAAISGGIRAGQQPGGSSAGVIGGVIERDRGRSATLVPLGGVEGDQLALVLRNCSLLVAACKAAHRDADQKDASRIAGLRLPLLRRYRDEGGRGLLMLGCQLTTA
jgi:hypothetical protein